jgi:hypothetical protein
LEDLPGAVKPLFAAKKKKTTKLVASSCRLFPANWAADCAPAGCLGG